MGCVDEFRRRFMTLARARIENRSTFYESSRPALSLVLFFSSSPNNKSLPYELGPQRAKAIADMEVANKRQKTDGSSDWQDDEGEKEA